MKKFTAMILALVMILALLCACGSSAKDVPVADISAKVDKALNMEGSLTEVDESYIKGFMKIDASSCKEYAVKINAFGANIDEYGIFKAENSNQAKEVKASVEAYLKLRLDTWMNEYMPEEKPKLTSAEIKTNGNYVMFCILSDADKSTAFDTFNAALK